MGTKNNNALFYTCSLIEFIGRQIRRTRKEVTDLLTRERIQRIYEFADVFHCDYWDIGEVYARLIEDCYKDEEIVEGIWEVYHSWMDAQISNYNSDFYYQPRDYIAACYEEGVVL